MEQNSPSKRLGVDSSYEEWFEAFLRDTEQTSKFANQLLARELLLGSPTGGRLRKMFGDMLANAVRELPSEVTSENADVANQQERLIDTLLECHPDYSNYGDIVMTDALMLGRDDLLDKIIAAGVRGIPLSGALGVVAALNRTDLAMKLIEAGADLTIDGSHALEMARFYEHKEMEEFLIARGARITEELF